MENNIKKFNDNENAYRYNILFVGNKGVGKSSVLN
jgi:predicted GTPase